MVAVIVVVPGAVAVAMPFVTVAIEGALELQVTLRSLITEPSAARAAAVNVAVSPTNTLLTDGVMDTLATTGTGGSGGVHAPNATRAIGSSVRSRAVGMRSIESEEQKSEEWNMQSNEAASSGA
jgi:hypothetical protein